MRGRQVERQLVLEVRREDARQKRGGNKAFSQKPPVPLKSVNVLEELWAVYTYYTCSGGNVRDPERLRKDSLVQLLRDCNLLAERKRTGR